VAGKYGFPAKETNAVRTCFIAPVFRRRMQLLFEERANPVVYGLTFDCRLLYITRPRQNFWLGGSELSGVIESIVL
jgi:hypothetical protein